MEIRSVRLSYEEIAAQMREVQGTVPQRVVVRVPDDLSSNWRDPAPLQANHPVDQCPPWLEQLAFRWTRRLNWVRYQFNRPQKIDLDAFDHLDWRDGRRRRRMLDLGRQTLEAWAQDGWVPPGLKASIHGAVRGDVAAVKVDEQHIRLNIRPGGHLPALDPSEVWVDAPFRFWHVLAHEAAHVAFDQVGQPFQPSNRTPQDQALLVDLNTHVFGRGATPHIYHQLNEGFADTYGAMIALHSAGYSASAQAQLMRFIDVREEDARRNAREIPVPWKGGMLDSYELTAPALKRMWLERETWMNQSPEQMHQRALEIVSDTWIETARRHVARQEVEDEPQRRRYAAGLSAEPVPTREQRILAWLPEDHLWSLSLSHRVLEIRMHDGVEAAQATLARFQAQGLQPEGRQWRLATLFAQAPHLWQDGRGVHGVNVPAHLRQEMEDGRWREERVRMETGLVQAVDRWNVRLVLDREWEHARTAALQGKTLQPPRIPAVAAFDSAPDDDWALSPAARSSSPPGRTLGSVLNASRPAASAPVAPAHTVRPGFRAR